MTGPFRRLVRDLTGRRDRDLLAHLDGQLDATLAAVAVTRSLAAGEVDPATARARVEDHERDGDAARRDLVEQLSTTLTAPVDREDLFRLSRSVDDVLDNLRDLAREFDLYAVTGEPLLEDALAGIEDGLRTLRDAAGCLLERPGDAVAGAAEAKRNDVRLRYQEAMGELLAGSDPVDRTVLARRELLRRVDVVGLRLAEAADALADGAVKRSL